MDPGRASCALIIAAIVESWSGVHDAAMSASSSSPTRRTSRAAPPTWCARWSATRCRSPSAAAIPDGGLGTDVEAIMRGDRQGLVGRGRRHLVDLGGAETNSEMAIELLPRRAARQGRRLQRADRRGRGDGGDRSLRRRHARDGEAAPPRNCRRIGDGWMAGARIAS